MPNFINLNELSQNGNASATNATEHHLNGGGNVLMNGKNDSIESNNIVRVEIKSNSDREIIRLIGQHLRGLGLK